MYIAIANSILSSSNSGSAGPPEYYNISDCIGNYGNFISAQYPSGTFVAGDMVTFVAGGVSGYGFVVDIAPYSGDDISIVGTGANQNQECTPSFIAFEPTIYTDYDQNIYMNLQGYTSGAQPVPHISVDGEYALTYNYIFDVYYTGFPNSGLIRISGSVVIPDYDLPSDDSFDLGNFVIYSNPAQEFYSAAIDGEVITSTTYNNTTAFSNDNGCSYIYFLKIPNGTTFNSYTRNDNC